VSARLALTGEAEDLVGAVTAELTEAAASTWPSTIGGARAFCARYPLPATFSALPVGEQLCLPAHQRRFACWLMVTARMSVSAQYLARAELRLGCIAARHHPALHTRLADTARTLGSDEVWVRDQWSALAQLAALHGVLPGQVSCEQLTCGGDALLAAFARPGHPKAGHKLRSALVRLRATLFHAGMTDTPPRLHRPNRGVVATAQWAAVAPGLTQTAQRYLAQIQRACGPRPSASPSRHYASSARSWPAKHPGSVAPPTSAATTSRPTSPGSPTAPEPVAAPCTGTPSAGTSRRCVASSNG